MTECLVYFIVGTICFVFGGIYYFLAKRDVGDAYGLWQTSNEKEELCKELQEVLQTWTNELKDITDSEVTRCAECAAKVAQMTGYNLNDL
jgi:hypothetical protein